MNYNELMKCSKEYLILQLEQLYQNNDKLNNIINKAIEELKIWQPKEKILQEEKEYLLDILKGDDNNE